MRTTGRWQRLRTSVMKTLMSSTRFILTKNGPLSVVHLNASLPFHRLSSSSQSARHAVRRARTTKKGGTLHDTTAVVATCYSWCTRRMFELIFGTERLKLDTRWIAHFDIFRCGEVHGVLIPTERDSV